MTTLVATLALGAAALESGSALAAPPKALEPPKKTVKPPATTPPAPTTTATAAPTTTATAAPTTTATAAPTAAATGSAAPPPAGSTAAPAGNASGAPAGSAAPGTGTGLSTFNAASLGKLDDRLEALRKRVEERQKTLDARRQADRDRIRLRWGSVVDLPAVRAELSTYAVRVARLERIQELAQVEAKPTVAARASKALDRENVRHERTMKALAAGAGGAK